VASSVSSSHSVASPEEDLLRLPLCKHVWFCWPLREAHCVTARNPAEGMVCITDHTSRRARAPHMARTLD